MALASATAGYATWYTVGLIGESWRYGDTSSGMVAVPLWIPQTPVAVGLGLLTVALMHTLVEVLFSRHALPRGDGLG